MSRRGLEVGRVLLVAAVSMVALAAVPAAQAKHSWGDWHWARAANPVTLPVANSTTDESSRLGQNWPALLGAAASDWSQSSVLDLTVGAPTLTDSAARAACAPQLGAIRVCNAENPDVTWLGLATVYSQPLGGGGHIGAATAQMNDVWFRTPLYNATNAQQVMCQEVGHTFGLDHQDVSGADLNTCMDYSDALDNPSPNAHDYQQLQTIYSHLDGGGSSGGKGGGKGGGGKGGGKAKAGSPLGQPPGYHGSANHGRPHSETYLARENGLTVVRYVIWAY